MLISPDGKNVYTTFLQRVRPVERDGGLSRDASSGVLTSLAQPTGCRTRPVIAGCTAIEDQSSPLNMAISPDGKSLYAGSSVMDGFASYDRDPATGALTKRPGCFSADGGWIKNTTTDGTPCTVAKSLRTLYSLHVAPDGKNLYALSQKFITTFDRDPATGTLTGRTGTSACISIDGDLETTAGNDNLCTAAGGVNILKRMVFAPNANHVYVGGAYNAQAGVTDAITLFDRAANGTLTRRATPTTKDGCIAWTDGPWSAGSCRNARTIGLIKAWTLSPDGKNVYVVGDQQGSRSSTATRRPGLLSEHAVPNGCITETGRSTAASAGTAGQCRVGGYALRSLSDLAVTPDGGLVVAGGNFGTNSADPIPPPRFTLGGVTALSRDATGALTMTGCYSSTRRSLASQPLTTGECAAARGLDNVPYGVAMAPDGQHVYFAVGPFDSPGRGNGLALFRVVSSSGPAPGPGVRVDAANASVSESGPNAVFTFQLLSPAIRQTTITYTTFDDSAKAGSDYTVRSGTATIAAGQSTATVSVPIVQDAIAEQPETFGLRITAADGAVITEPEATGSITDDDGRPAPPAISIGAAEVVEGGVLRLPLTRAPADAPDVSSLSWSVVGGTATAGVDFTTTGGSLTVMPLGDVAIEIPIKGDDVFEGDETVIVRLAGPYAATLGSTDATGTIRDDDTAPQVPIDEGGGVFVTPPTTVPTPAPKPPVTTVPATPKPQAAVLGLPATKKCASRRSFRITIKAPRGEKAKAVVVLVNGKKVKSLTGKKVTAPVDLRGLPKGKFTVKVTLTTVSGKTLVQTRAYKTCAPKPRKG